MGNLDGIIIKEEDIVRFAIFFGVGNSTNFNTNLRKMVEIVLHKVYPNTLSNEKIAEEIRSMYQMEFTNEEIYNAILTNKRNRFEIDQNDRKTKHLEVRLNAKTYQNIDGKYAEKNISGIVNEFYEKHTEFSSFGIEKIEEIIKRYIYLKFNKDAKELKAILTLSPADMVAEDRAMEFNEDEKEILNAFFSWENTKKDEVIYEILSSALEYCMLTTRKGNSISKTMFQGKVFYLDTNIIFRLAGLNGEERTKSSQKFIQKCKDCGIKLKYTNFTKEEINNTLDSAVNYYKYVLRGKCPMGQTGMEALEYNMPKKELYEVYLEWTKDTNNKYDDYASFRKYLDKQIVKVLNKFEMDTKDSYAGLKAGEDFDIYVRELTEYKEQNNAKSNNPLAVKMDIENYMFMQEKANQELSKSLWDKKYYFISADHRLINWAIEKTPGVVPIFVLPSFWYSFMLKYHGRAEDDFSAFCQFLKLRPAYKEPDIPNSRAAIVARIMEMDESTEIKDEIALDASTKLREFKEELNPEEIEAVMKEAVDSVIEKKADIAVREKLKTYEDTHRAEVANSRDEGRRLEKEEIVMRKANQMACRNKKIKCAMLILGILAILFGIYLLVKQQILFGEESKILKWGDFLNNGFVQLGIGLILILGGKVTDLLGVLEIDPEKLKDKAEKKLYK